MKPILIIALLLLCSNVFGQKKGIKEVQIQTSAQCLDCKERIEEKLIYAKGVKYAILDDRTKIVSVTYLEKKINVEQIKQLISEVGYDADDIKASKEGFEKLPMCCRPGGH